MQSHHCADLLASNPRHALCLFCLYMKFVIIFDTYALGVINLLPAFVKIKISFFIEKMIKIISQLIQKTIQF